MCDPEKSFALWRSHDQAPQTPPRLVCTENLSGIGPASALAGAGCVTRQRIDGLNAVHVYLSKYSPRSETSLRTCGRRLLASPCPSRMLAFTPRECRFN